MLFSLGYATTRSVPDALVRVYCLVSSNEPNADGELSQPDGNAVIERASS